MPILYVDNYRGFQDTYIPLKDVNFFVGENSTGKTSILSLIRILDSVDFWLFSTFNTNEITLGQFDEIVSKGKKSFGIGIFRGNSNIVPNIGEVIYMSFINHEGLPFISELSYIHNNLNIKILFKDEIKYKAEKIDENFVMSDSIESFKQWINHMRTLKKGFTISKNDLKHKPYLRRVMWQIEDEIEEKENIPKSKSGSPFSGGNTNWIAPIRAKPKRIYESYNILKFCTVLNPTVV